MGMLQRAQQRLAELPGTTFTCLDAQFIPATDNYFDIVTANHMLYHVPDIHRSLREIKRVLKPSGKLLAATNGEQHMRELGELIRSYYPQYQGQSDQVRRFSLENAAEYLQPYFNKIVVRRYEENLLITELEPLLAYIRSLWSIYEQHDQHWAKRLENRVREAFESEGKFFITKSQGVVIGLNES